eukprot:SAG11_NODE_1937_length_4032_cov_6.541826_2_plen_101_part_00
MLRYVPWWLSVQEFGSGPCRTFIPKEIYTQLPPAAQLLYRHAAEGVADYLQPESQRRARRAMFDDQPALRQPGVFGDNSFVKVGEVNADAWRQGQSSAKL